MSPDESESPQQIGDGIVARGYEVWRDGVYQGQSGRLAGQPPSIDVAMPRSLAGNRKKITRRALWVDEIGKTIDTHEPLVRLGFMTPDMRTEHIWIDRAVIADARLLTRLASRGLPVDSQNAREVVSYLGNSEDLTGMQCTPRMVGHRSGPYHINAGDGWLIGDRWIGPGHLDSDPRVKSRFASGLVTAGSWEVWRDKWREMYEMNWACRHLIATTFTSPLLRYLPCRTHVVHHWGESSMGKSALASFALSAWGDPDLLMFSFSSTRNALTEIFRNFTDLPSNFDELQVRSKDDYSNGDFIRLTCQRWGRERVEKDGGLRKAITGWKTVVRTTGEQPIVEDNDIGGQGNRVIQISASALPSREYGEQLYSFFAQHHGHAGPMFLTRLAEMIKAPGGVDQIQALYKDMSAAVAASATSRANPNHIKFLAATAVAQALAAVWLLEIDTSKAWATAVKDAGYALEENDPGVQTSFAEKALGVLQDYHAAHPFEFKDMATFDGRKKIEKGLDFVRNIMGVTMSEGVAYLPDQVNTFLKFKGMSPERIWSDFAKLGWLYVFPGERVHTYMPIGGAVNRRVYAIKRDVFFGDATKRLMPGIDLTAIAASERVLNLSAIFQPTDQAPALDSMPGPSLDEQWADLAKLKL